MDVLAFDVRRDRLISEVRGFEYANLDDVIVTPHIAFNSVEALRRILDVTENVRSFLAGAPQNTVDA